MKVDIIISQLELQVKTAGKEAGKARKREWLNQGWVKFWIWLVKRVARVFWTNHRVKFCRTKAVPDYCRHSVECLVTWVALVLCYYVFCSERKSWIILSTNQFLYQNKWWLGHSRCRAFQAVRFFFFLPKSLSSSLKNALLCSDEPVFYLDSKSKCAPFSVIILSTKRSFNDDKPLLCIYC